MVKESTEIIQAFPLGMGTQVFSSGVTGFEIKGSKILHMNEDGDITLHGGSASILVNALAGSDWAIDAGTDYIDVTVSCIIS
jgi:hypothetical protein